MVNLAIKQLLVPLGKRAGYLEARKIVGELGHRLPSHVLHDDYLVRTDLWKGMRGLYPAWARELVVHPERNGKFQRGKDVVGAYEAVRGRNLVFPAAYIPEEAVGREKIGLFVDPADVKVETYHGKDTVIVHAQPESIVVLQGLPQTNGGVGRVDEATRIPLEVPPEVLAALTDKEKRWLFRTDGANVGLLVRNVDGLVRRRIVYANLGHDGAFGVAVAMDVDVAKAAAEVLALLPPEQREALTRLAEAARAH